jgi:rhodanese-related sulfurtransferase/rubrerythrin
MKLLVILTTILMLFSGCQRAAISTTDSGVPNVATEIKEVSPADAEAAVSKAYSQFIDVRTPEEYSAGHADRSVNIPLDIIGSSLDRLEKNEPVYLICQTGNRSRKAAGILKEAGFNNVLNVTGGTVAWKAAGLPMADLSSTASKSSGKLEDKTEKALLSALEDERRAQATYEAVLWKFPDARPFSNIIGAEQRHESYLLPLFAKYGVNVPKNEFDSSKIPVPDSLPEACATGVALEKENIALYDGFLGFVKEADIKDVFTRLQSASRDNHLPAFTRCSEGRMGNGPGRGQRP